MDIQTENRIKTMLPLLNERQRRLFLAAEAEAIGYGGISQVSQVSGVSRVTITLGVKELKNEDLYAINNERSRKGNGGRKKTNYKKSSPKNIF